MRRIKIIVLACLINSGLVQANESILLESDTGDSLMLNRLNDGELWGSFMITDKLVDSFADYELIVLQVDQNKPIKLDHQKQCGGGIGDDQKVEFSFESAPDSGQWQFSEVISDKPDILKLTGWDKDSFHHMRSDRRPEVVDFPIQGELAIDSLWHQFKHGERVVFRYTTESGETRQAEFNLLGIHDKF